MACRVGLCFQLPLERDGPPGVLPEIGTAHADHHRRVGVPAAAGMVAHAVGHHPVFLAGRGHHLPAGAHTEGVHAPLPHMLGQLVFAAGQSRVACRLVIQALLDLALQVLCAEPHAEGFALQHKAAVHQHGKGVPGRVAHREHQCLAGKGTAGGKNAGDASVCLFQAGEGGVEMHLAAQGFDLLADRGDDPPQQVGAHMGLLLPGDLRRGTVLQKHLGDKAAQLVADAGGQLAVREGACAALTELNVRVGVQLAGGGKMFHRLHPLVQRRAALQHDGPVALPRQQQRRKQARRPQAAHHRAVGQLPGALLHPELRSAVQGHAG